MAQGQVHISRIAPEDAEQLLGLQHRLDRETRFIMLEPDERTTSLAEIRRIIDATQTSDSQAIIVADVGQTVVGYIEAMRGDYRRYRHSANLVAGVLRSHSGRGIGRLLIEAVEKWAREVGITSMQLTVR